MPSPKVLLLRQKAQEAQLRSQEAAEKLRLETEAEAERRRAKKAAARPDESSPAVSGKTEKKPEKKNTLNIPSLIVNGVTKGMVKKNDAFRAIGLDRSPEAIEAVKNLTLEEFLAIAARIGNSTATADASVVEKTARPFLAGLGKRERRNASQMMGELAELVKEKPKYFEGYKAVWIKMRDPEYALPVPPDPKPAQNVAVKPPAEKEPKRSIDYNKVVREEDLFAPLGITPSAAGRKVVESFTRKELEELEGWLRTLEAPPPPEPSKSRFGLLATNNALMKTTSVDELPPDIAPGFRKWLEGQETGTRVIAEKKPDWATAQQALSNKIAEAEEGGTQKEAIRDARRALRKLRTLSNKLGGHLERHNAAWIALHEKAGEFAKQYTPQEKEQLARDAKAREILEKYFEKCRKEYRANTAELHARIRAEGREPGKSDRAKPVIPVLRKATIHDDNPYFLVGDPQKPVGVNISRVEIRGDAILDEMDLRGVELKAHGHQSYRGAILGEDSNGKKTRFSPGSSVLHLQGLDPKTFNPDHVDGLFEAGYKPPVEKKAASEEAAAPVPVKPKKVRKNKNRVKIDWDDFAKWLAENPPVLSEYAVQKHDGNMNFLSGKRDISEHITFPEGTRFNVNLEGTTGIQLPKNSDFRDAKLGWNEKTQSNTRLHRSSSAEGLKWNPDTFTAYTVEGLPKSIRKLIDPDSVRKPSESSKHRAEKRLVRQKEREEALARSAEQVDGEVKKVTKKSLAGSQQLVIDLTPRDDPDEGPSGPGNRKEGPLVPLSSHHSRIHAGTYNASKSPTSLAAARDAGGVEPMAFEAPSKRVIVKKGIDDLFPEAGTLVQKDEPVPAEQEKTPVPSSLSAEGPAPSYPEEILSAVQRRTGDDAFMKKLRAIIDAGPQGSRSGRERE